MPSISVTGVGSSDTNSCCLAIAMKSVSAEIFVDEGGSLRVSCRKLHIIIGVAALSSSSHAGCAINCNGASSSDSKLSSDLLLGDGGGGGDVAACCCASGDLPEPTPAHRLSGASMTGTWPSASAASRWYEAQARSTWQHCCPKMRAYLTSLRVVSTSETQIVAHVLLVKPHAKTQQTYVPFPVMREPCSMPRSERVAGLSALPS